MSGTERRQAIVDAALPLFAEHGLSGVTTRQIAQAAGVSEALLYRHFASKDEIFAAIQDCCVSHAGNPADYLKSLPNDTKTLITCIHTLMWKIQSQAGPGNDEPDSFHRLMIRSLLADGTFAASFQRRTSVVWVDKMRACVKAAIAAGDVDVDGTEAELGIWLGHHLSVMIRLYSLSGEEIVSYPVPRDQLLEHSVRFCLRGIGMRREAVEAHYRPAELNLFLSGTFAGPQS